MTSNHLNSPRILLVTSDRKNPDSILRQIPQDSPLRDIYSFNLSSDADFACIMHHSAIPQAYTCPLPKERIIYISMEPSESASNVSHRFLSQFGTVVTSDPLCLHEHVIPENVHSWWTGLDVSIINKKHIIKFDRSKNYEYYNDLPLLPLNKRTVASITSSKNILPGHLERDSILKFLEKSNKYFNLELWGRGSSRPFLAKDQVLMSAPFHLAIENTIQKSYWTEKLADCFLCGTRPIYLGDPTILEQFPLKSIAAIPISFSHKQILEYIADVVDNPQNYFCDIALREARSLILDKYNLLVRIPEICNQVSLNNKLAVDIPIQTSLLLPNAYFVQSKYYYYLKNAVRSFRW
jgi:hypothetical protein